MSISVALKRFINEYRDEINNNEFDNLYAEWPGRTWELTFVLLKSGIDPLETLGWVPDYYANEFTLIKDVKLNDDIVEVGEHAFTKCINLEHLFIPASVEEIGAWCFYGCEKLKEVTYDGTFEELKQVHMHHLSFESNVKFICNDGETTFIDLLNYWVKQ